MTESVEISVIIPWKDRSELRRCLEANLRFFPADQCEVIIVNCGGDASTLYRLVGGLPANIRTICTRRDSFNKCFAQNVGASAASGETLLLLDTDVLLDVDLPTLARELMGPADFLTVASVHESDTLTRDGVIGLEIAHLLEITVPGGKTVKIETNRTRPLAGVRSGPGLLAVRSRHYAAINGANSLLHGWGWEDLDVIARLQFELGLTRIQAGSVTHISHPDCARMLEGRSRFEREQENFLTCLANYAAGVFRGTMSDDIQVLYDGAEK